MDAVTAARNTRVDEDCPDPTAFVRVRIGMHVGPVTARCRLPLLGVGGGVWRVACGGRRVGGSM